MKRLILTTSASGSGSLRQARIADSVFGLEQTLVYGQLPSISQSFAFFAPCVKLGWDDQSDHWSNWAGYTHLEKMGLNRPGLIDVCKEYQAIDLWVDPLANAQLNILQLLDFLRPYSEVIEKLSLFQSDVRIAEHGPGDLAAWNPSMQKVGRDHLETARIAWDAFGHATPEAWFGLLNRDLSSLPYLRQTVTELLEELPAATTGLGSTEMLLLKLLSGGKTAPYDVFPGYQKDNHRHVFEYWEVGQMLDGLAHCPDPAVLGLDEGPFTLEMHDDRERHQRYKASRLSLSDLGRRLVEYADDFSRYNPIRRWWGGTELTNARLWRWDFENRNLIVP